MINHINPKPDFYNHQWVLSYGEIVRTIDFKKSDEYVQEIMNDMIQEHRDKQLKKIMNDDENT